MTVRLEQLLAAATPGEWVFDGSELFADEGNGVGPLLMASEADCLLAARSKNMARLLIDMGEALREVVEGSMWECPFCGLNMENDGHKDDCEYAALLARLDALGKDTA